MSPGTVGKCSY